MGLTQVGRFELKDAPDGPIGDTRMQIETRIKRMGHGNGLVPPIRHEPKSAHVPHFL